MHAVRDPTPPLQWIRAIEAEVGAAPAVGLGGQSRQRWNQVECDLATSALRLLKLIKAKINANKCVCV